MGDRVGVGVGVVSTLCDQLPTEGHLSSQPLCWPGSPYSPHPKSRTVTFMWGAGCEAGGMATGQMIIIRPRSVVRKPPCC